MRHPYWPLFDLRVRTERLELRPVGEDDAIALASLAARGIHDPDWLPFAVPWSIQPSPQLERGAVQHYWRAWANWTADNWHLPLAVICDGEVVGTQGFGGRKFPVLRTVNSGSWLGRDHQGKGIGKEMRAAMLHLAFAGLGARYAVSGAWHDNAPSLGVSRALGYEENGVDIAERLGNPDRQIGLLLTRERWEAHRAIEVHIENLAPCLEFFGLASDLLPLEPTSSV
ncbi:MAG TPA: GNAT family N-acetyltransferase [Aeromicrobium sp.]|nr:GNAT family N-acetyltransferase [Aeromicrobium sp.]